MLSFVVFNKILTPFSYYGLTNIVIVALVSLLFAAEIYKMSYCVTPGLDILFKIPTQLTQPSFIIFFKVVECYNINTDFYLVI